jgi:hypothetical protein
MTAWKWLNSLSASETVRWNSKENIWHAKTVRTGSMRGIGLLCASQPEKRGRSITILFSRCEQNFLQMEITRRVQGVNRAAGSRVELFPRKQGRLKQRRDVHPKARGEFGFPGSNQLVQETKIEKRTRNMFFNAYSKGRKTKQQHTAEGRSPTFMPDEDASRHRGPSFVLFPSEESVPGNYWTGLVRGSSSGARHSHTP